LNRALQHSLIYIALVVGPVVMTAQAKELDCSKEVYSSADNLYCVEARLDAALEQLRAINAEISKLMQENVSDERRKAVVKELADANRTWLDFAQKYCRALNAERGGGRWPEFWTTSCILDEANNRIQYLCAPDVSADPWSTCARAQKALRPQ
jgi:uncharacterized protein YecT (DUF1311 family)